MNGVRLTLFATAAQARVATFVMSALGRPCRQKCVSSPLRRARRTVSIVAGSLALAALIFLRSCRVFSR